jgi:HTH-type transcriptional regulator, transcriptional repressor of NAD biosynthesis genes
VINQLFLVCLYGPESTGKTELAKVMAKYFQTEYVPEVAREFITSNDFSIEDIIKIGEEQARRIKAKQKTANRILFCDTDLITTQIYSSHYLGVVPPVLIQLENEIRFDQYFLFDNDVPWVADGLRDLENHREEMLDIFKNELEKRAIPYKWIKGTYKEREATMMKEMNALLGIE